MLMHLSSIYSISLNTLFDEKGSLQEEKIRNIGRKVPYPENHVVSVCSSFPSPLRTGLNSNRKSTRPNNNAGTALER